MDQGTLVECEVHDGQRLIDRLIAEGVPVSGAAWIKESENGRWYLRLITALVPDGGDTRPAYGRVNEVIRKLQEGPFWVDPLRIRVVEPSSPFGEAVAELYARERRRFPMRYDGYRLGDVYIDGAYIYPPVVATRGEVRAAHGASLRAQ